MTKSSAVFLLALVSCTRVTPPAARPAAPVQATARVDTVTITRDLSPAVPDGTPAELCLATGLPIQVHLASNGDTLIGPRRVPLRELAGLVIEGRYAAAEPWFQKAEPIRFERRSYRKLEVPVQPKCDDIKKVGENAGIPLYADLMVLTPIETLYVPVAPGKFQPYRTTLPRR